MDSVNLKNPDHYIYLPNYLASYHVTLILRVTRTVRNPHLTNRSINLNCAVTPNVLTEFTQAGKVNDKHQKVKTGYNSLKQ
jgi:hypothetical protein